MKEIDEKEVILEEEIAPEEGDFDALPGEPAVYEIAFHVLPSLEETEVSDIVASVRSEIEKKGGSVIAEEPSKKILLAYPVEKRYQGGIDRFIQAHFCWLKAELSPTDAPEIQEMLRTHKSVLRTLVARTTKEDTLLAGRQFIQSEMKDKEKEKKVQTGTTPEAEAEKGPVSEEELDRSLEKLIV